jgi:hypothetical protein
MDSITMIATSTADKNTLFKSPFLNAEIEGKYKLTTTDASLTRSLLITTLHLP